MWEIIEILAKKAHEILIKEEVDRVWYEDFAKYCSGGKEWALIYFKAIAKLYPDVWEYDSGWLIRKNKQVNQK